MNSLRSSCIAILESLTLTSAIIPSSAQLMFTDGLHCIFAFLDLHELLPAIHSCRSWRDAAYKERCRGIKTNLESLSAGILTSPLRHHVIGSSHRQQCSLTNLMRFLSLPSLTSIDVKLNVLDPLWTNLTLDDWPTRLRNVVIAFTPTSIAQNIEEEEEQLVCIHQKIIEFVSRNQSLESFFFVPANQELTNDFDLTPLQRLPSLSKLILFIVCSHSQLMVLKQLSSLTHLQVNNRLGQAAESLHMLCSPPHQLQKLQDFCIASIILSAIEMNDLIHLPSLTSIVPSCMRSNALPFLRRFTQLRSVFIWSHSMEEPLSARAIIDNLAPCPALKKVDLSNCTFSSDELRELAIAIPLLELLRLRSVYLADFRGLAVCKHLREFQLDWCDGVHADWILQLAPIASLRVLSIRGILSEELSEARSILNIPSKQLPQLIDAYATG